MIRESIRLVLIPALMLIASSAFPPDAAGQLLTQHVKGAVGLKAGSQPPPGGYVVLPLAYVYNTGMGMWGYEPVVATTVYLDASKKYHAATELSFDFQSKKEDRELVCCPKSGRA